MSTETPVTALSKHGLFAVENKPRRRGAGTVVLAHGINADHTEGRQGVEPGLFDLLVEALADRGIGTLRWDFRGHGRSRRAAEGVSIDSEVTDLRAVLSYLRATGTLRGLLGCSFGACATAIVGADLAGADLAGADLGNAEVGAAVFLNPVLRPYETLFDPGTPWSRRTLGPRVVPELQDGGTVLLDGTFPVSKAMLDSTRAHDVLAAVGQLNVPLLFVHGSSDSYVPWEYTRAAATGKNHCFISVNSEHGFPDPADRRFITALVAEFFARYQPIGRQHTSTQG